MTLIAAYVSENPNDGKKRLTIGCDLRISRDGKSVVIDEPKFIHKEHLIIAVAGRNDRILPALQDMQIPPPPKINSEDARSNYIKSEVYHYIVQMLKDEELLKNDPHRGVCFDGEMFFCFHGNLYLLAHGLDRPKLRGNVAVIGSAESEAKGAIEMAKRYTSNPYEIIRNTLEIASDLVDGIKPPYDISTFDWNIEAEEWEEATDYAIQNPPIEVAVLSDSIPQEVYTDLETPALSNHAKQYASMVESEY